MFILEAATAATACSIPADIVNVISTIIKVIKILVPVILIVVGMIEMAKAMTHQKEDEIKKAQSSLIKKAVVALIIFLMPALVSWVFGLVGSGEKGTGWECVTQVIDGVPKVGDACTPTIACGTGQTGKFNADGSCSCQ